MTEQRGLPEPPPVGTLALPAGTYTGSSVFITGGGTGLGKAIATEFARLGADVVIASRKTGRLRPGAESANAQSAGQSCEPTEKGSSPHVDCTKVYRRKRWIRK